MVFSDGSSTNTGADAAFCATEGGDVTHWRVFTLDDHNYNLQAELFVIYKALLCISKKTVIF